MGVHLSIYLGPFVDISALSSEAILALESNDAFINELAVITTAQKDTVLLPNVGELGRHFSSYGGDAYPVQSVDALQMSKDIQRFESRFSERLSSLRQAALHDLPTQFGAVPYFS